MTGKQFTGFLWCILLLVFSIGKLHSQTGIANYAFSQSIGSSFPALTGGTVVFSGPYHDTVSNAIDLGGTFVFGGVAYTQCYISSNGFITFGAAPSRTNWEPLSTLNSTTGAIAAFGTSGDGSAALGASPQISYGNSGNDFVVQYLDHSARSGLNSERLNFQIRLHLTANAISLVYGSFTAPSSSNAVQVGIRGASIDWVTNVNNLSVSTVPFGNTCTWENASTGNANNSRMAYNILSPNVVPPLNLTYTWTPAFAPAPVRTFYAVSNITGHAATIKWAPAAGATQCHVQYRIPGACSWMTPGSSTVNDTTATLTGLSAGTAYQVRVQSVSSNGISIWSHIPAGSGGTGTDGYNLSGTFTTSVTCAAPTAIFIASAITAASISFTSTGSSFIAEYGPVGFTPGTGTTAGTGGTIVTGTSSPLILSGLGSGTSYDVYMRQNCTAAGEGFSTNSKVTFATLCNSATDFFETFNTSNSLPVCFKQVGTNGAVSVQSALLGSVGSAYSNALYIVTNSAALPVVALLPPVSNAGAGTHQLRFKAKPNFSGYDTLEVGYLTNVNDPSTFVLLNQFVPPSSTFTDYTVVPGSASGVSQYLAFRLKKYTGTGMYIDDIHWEVIPGCTTPASVRIGSITNNSASVSFTATGGSSYIVEYGVAGFIPGTGSTAGAAGTIATGTGSPITISGLSAATTYDVYVRQVCASPASGYSNNSVTATFLTVCSPVTSFSENFDASASLPLCFRKVGTGGYVSLNTNASSAPRALYMESSISAVFGTSLALVALPPVSNAGAGTHWLRFKLKDTSIYNADTLQVGYLTNVNDSSSFVELSRFTAPLTSAYIDHTVIPGTAPGSSQHLAFRVKGASRGDWLIDDIYWEAIPACRAPDTPRISSVTATSASVSFTPTTGSSSGSFMVEYGFTGFTPGTGATAGTGGSIVTGAGSPIMLNGMTPGTIYDVYVRQNCTASGNGYSLNSAKATFTTLCSPVNSFYENFDASINNILPICFRRVGTGGTVAVPQWPVVGSSPPKSLFMSSSSASSQAVVALPWVNNAGAGTHQLRFKMVGNYLSGDILEIGYLTNINDSSTFVTLSQVYPPSVYVYTSFIIYPGTAPGSNQYLAFRTKGSYTDGVVIDDIYWEPLPACPAPVSVSVGAVTNNAASVSFTAPGSGSFIVEYGPSGFTPGTGAAAGTGGTIVIGTSSPMTLTGLTPSTNYQVYVRQNCTVAGNGYSANSNVVSFTTAIACPSPVDVRISAITPITATVSFTSTGNSFIVEYGLTGFTPGIGATAGTGGTVVTGASSPIVLTGLGIATTYDVYVRQNCTGQGYGYSANSAKMVLTTMCVPVTTYSQNFEASTAPNTTLPACFRRVGTGGYAAVYPYSTSSSPNALFINASNTSQGIVALPPVSNAGTGTHQLRFKLRAYYFRGDTLQVGYLTNVTDSSTFVVLNQFNSPEEFLPYAEFIVRPGTAPGSNQYLAFRAKGTSTNGVMIDDIFWETIPACLVADTVRVSAVTTSSAVVNFVSTGSSFIVEYGPTGFTPGTGATAGIGGTVVSGGSSPITLTGVGSGINYDVYVRQNCTVAGNGYSANSVKAVFTTYCNPVTSFYENFDAGTDLPICFKKVGNAGYAYIDHPASSLPNALYLYSSSLNSQGVVALPPVSNAGAGTHQLRFKLAVNRTISDTLQVGYLTNINDSSTFVVLTQIRPALTSIYTEYIVVPGTAPGLSQYLAFKAKGSITTGLLIDDIYWEPIPACPSPVNVSTGSITDNSASISFTSTGSSFIVEYGPSGFTPGTGATAGTSGTIVTGASSPITLNGLGSGTNYDLYVRQICSAPGNGFSNNTLRTSFTTLCGLATSFYENFDLTTSLPVCVKGVGTGGGVSVTSYGASFPNSLFIQSNFINSQAVAALRPVSNAGAGTHQLRFKLKAYYTPGDTLQVGYLTNINDSSTFVVLSQLYAPPTSSSVYTEYIVLPGTAPGNSQYLAFRAKGSMVNPGLLIDDIYWEPKPACPAPVFLTVGSVTASSATVSFTSTGSSFIAEYGVAGFTPGTGATAGTGGTVVTGNSSPITLTGLSGSTNYQVYIRQNCTATGNGYSANSLAALFATLVTNDNASGAINLIVGVSCTGATYSNVGATLGAGEPFPSCSGTVGSAPVWFKFVAPNSGAVRISTDVGSGNTFIDSRIALFSATSPSDYSTFSIISCDEDGGSVLSSGLMSVLYATGLSSGTTYYVAVDKRYSPYAGSFCITVSELDSSMLSKTNTCASTYQTPLNGNITTYTGWISLMDASSKLVALVRNPSGTNPSAYTVGQNINTGMLRHANGSYYLDRNFRIANTTATNVNVQLFFLASELNALVATDPTVMLSNLGITLQRESPSGCYNNYNPANGSITFIPQTGNGNAGDVQWVSFTTPGFSNFYLNRTGTALPISLAYFKGNKAGSSNMLTWKVACTSASNTMILERSSDGRRFDHNVTSINATQADCNQSFNVTDAFPLNGTNYYRLKMIDIDGTVSYSAIITILNGGTRVELIGIYPTLVHNEALLSVTTSRATQMQIRISDMSGRVIQTLSQFVAAGSSLINLNTSYLANGTYNITGLLDGIRTHTLRFVKQ